MLYYVVQSSYVLLSMTGERARWYILNPHPPPPLSQVLLASRRAEGEAGRLEARWEAVVCEPTWLEVREAGGRGQADAPVVASLPPW